MSKPASHHQPEVTPEMAEAGAAELRNYLGFQLESDPTAAVAAVYRAMVRARPWFTDADLMAKYGFSKADLDRIRAQPQSRQLAARTREFWK